MNTLALELDSRGIIRSCPQCGRRNRLPYERLGGRFHCAQCKAVLPPPKEPVMVDDVAMFDALLRSSKVPVLVDFWASWCGPCRMLAPELERVALTADGRWLVAKVNTEYHDDLASRFQIVSLPTLVLVRRGVEAARISGARPANEIVRFIQHSVA